VVSNRSQETTLMLVVFLHNANICWSRENKRTLLLRMGYSHVTMLLILLQCTVDDERSDVL
jgi:hypothetical protein